MSKAFFFCFCSTMSDFTCLLSDMVFPGHRTMHILLFSMLLVRYFCYAHCNSWDNNEFWHLIEASAPFLLQSLPWWCHFVYISTTSQRWQRIKVTFAKCRIRYRVEQKKKTTTQNKSISLSFFLSRVNEIQRWKLTFIIMEMGNRGKTLSFSTFYHCCLQLSWDCHIWFWF